MDQDIDYLKRIKSIGENLDDRNYLIIGTEQGTLKVWDLKENKESYSFIKSIDKPITAIVPRKKLDAIYTATQDGEIQVWDCVEKSFSNILEDAHKELSINEDEKILVSCSHDKSIKLWNLEDSKLIREFSNAHKDLITAMTVDSHFTYIITGAIDGSIHVNDPEGKREVSVFPRGHKKTITGLIINYDADKLYSCSIDRVFQVWNFLEKNGIYKFEQKDPILYMTIFKETYIACGLSSGLINIVDLEKRTSKTYLTNPEKTTKSLCFVDEGNKLYALSPTSLTLWDINKGAIIKELHQAHEKQITGQLIRNDNKTLITSSLDGRLRFWDVATKSLTYSMESAQKSGITKILLNKDNSLLYTGSADGNVKYWDIKTKTLKNNLPKSHEGAITGLILIKDEKKLLTSSEDTFVKCWDLLTLKVIHAFEAHIYPVNNIVVDLKEEWLFTSARDEGVKIWKLDDKIETLKVAKSYNSRPIRAIKTSTHVMIAGEEDPFIFISDNRSIVVWDYKQQIMTDRLIDAHDDTITAMTICCDDRFLFTSSKDHMTRIWGLKVKECVYVLKQPQESTSFITQLTVTHDFRTLIASTNIGTIEQYDVDKRLKDIRLKIDDFIRQESFFKHKPNLHDQLILMQEQYRALEDRYKDLEERHSEAQQSSEFWKEHSMQLEQGSEKSGKKMSSRNNSSLDMAFVTPNKSFGVNESVIERQTPSQSFFIQVPYKSDSSQFETPVAYESGNFGSGDKKTKSSVLSSSEREKSESNIKTSESESRKEYSE